MFATGLEVRAAALEAQGTHLGAPRRLFVEGGRRQLMALLHHGLTPSSRVLDIGCGALRAGYWLIHFLETGCYFGIEPDAEMLAGGIEHILEPGLADEKKPIFDSNGSFDFGVFGTAFDFFLARSIWTHAPKRAIEATLDGFSASAKAEAVLLASFLPASWWRGNDYWGSDWRFVKSARNRECGMLRHSLRWIRHACAQRGLVVQVVVNPAFDFGDQTWLCIRSAS